jgi:hypothetical protein
VATQQIVQSLSYITWGLLGGLAVGSLAMAWLLRQATDATKGYLAFTAVLAAVMGLLWLLVELSLPLPTDLAIAPAPQLDEARRAGIGAFGLLALAAGVRFGQGHRARWLGLAAVGAGGLIMALAAYGWAEGAAFAVPLLIAQLALAAVTGGSLAAVILAHWYLVTPRISEQPLILATRVLAWALAVQVLLFVSWQVVGLDGGDPFAALTGPNALLVWLRLFVGLLFPLVLAVMAYRTALTRSMESATGLLYIELAAVLASTIVAAGLMFAEGVLV